MAADKKDTIYVDIDDEITGIIDKLRSSDSKVVALVLPKRATTFQSIVNMKLLKRAADADGKNLVLITAEAGLMPLAGAAGVHVAKTLNSKPEIPAGPDDDDDEEETIDETGEELPEDAVAETAGAATVGALAGAAAAKKSGGDDIDTVELDNTEPASATNPKPKSFAPPKGGKKGKKDSKLKVPDFNKFKLLLIIGVVALIALIVFGYMAIKVWPKATITIDTNATTFDTNIDLNLSTTATSLNEEDRILPAKRVEQQKTYTQEIATTGQKNNGNKASGTVTITNCARVNGEITLAAGTGITSGGNTFITQQAVTIPESQFSGGGNCSSGTGKASVNVIAQSSGTASNGANNFNIPSHAGLSGSGSTSGGTDNIVRVVNQNDINNAQSKITSDDKGVESDLEDQLKDAGYYPIAATYSTGTPAVTTSAKVGQVADNVTVTQTTTYSMFGVKEKDLKKLVNNEIEAGIDTNEQSVLDDGIKSANFTMNSSSSTGAQVAMQGKATVGPEIDIPGIRRDAMGKKSPEVKEMFNDNPDITNVDVKLSPFWVSSVPNDEKKVIIKIAKPTSNNTNSSND